VFFLRNPRYIHYGRPTDGQLVYDGVPALEVFRRLMVRIHLFPARYMFHPDKGEDNQTLEGKEAESINGKAG
jgi:hypothetical protein